MKEKLKVFFSKYLDLIFRVGLMITIISVWNELGRVRTWCYTSTDGPFCGGIEKATILYKEQLFRHFIDDTFPLVIFLSIFYVVFWFFKKDK